MRCGVGHWVWVPRKRLKIPSVLSQDNGDGGDILCQSFTLSLQQTMASLRTFQFTLHQPKRLAGREDRLTALIRTLDQ
jgi:hypothetical protein